MPRPQMRPDLVANVPTFARLLSIPEPTQHFATSAAAEALMAAARAPLHHEVIVVNLGIKDWRDAMYCQDAWWGATMMYRGISPVAALQ